MPGAHIDQNRPPDTLELELQMVLATTWVLGIEPGSPGRVAVRQLYSPYFYF